MRRLQRLLLLSSFLAPAAAADEGMWLLNQFPSDAVKKADGFAPDAKWLHHVQLGSVRLAGGCSGAVRRAGSDGAGLAGARLRCRRGP